MNLSGKKILFIGIGFYDYEQFIKSELITQGAKVSYFTERGTSHLFTLKEKWYTSCKRDLKPLYERHQKAVLESITDENFDYVFVIKGGLLGTSFLESLKSRYASAKFIMYQWDSLNRVDGIENILGYFDKILSFDPKDCAENSNLIFRPLFHREQTFDAKYEKNESYDISFIGWMHNERLEFINAFLANFNNQRKFYVFLYTGFYTFLKYFLKGKASYLNFQTMKYNECRSIMLASHCVLDLPHGLQTGLTMRAIESVGFRKKLITTSKSIINYDFYCKENVFILDDNYSLSELESFLDSPYKNLDDEIYDNYQVRSWLNVIFS